MKIQNLSPFLFGAKVTSRRPPEPEMVAIVRGTFTLEHGGTARVVEGVHPLVAQGALTSEVSRGGEDGGEGGAAIYPDDFADFKLRADVLLRAACHTPGGAPMAVCPVRFAVGSFSKILRVAGPRVWIDDALGSAMTEPVPFTTMPIGWTNAFGGPGFEGNPVGKGHKTRELPIVEDPRALIRSRGDKPDPAGFGPIARDWPLRKNKLGKAYGPTWKKTRAPYFAEDFDWSFFNAAPPDQQIEGYLRGDEELIFQNLHPAIPVYACKLPGVKPRVFVRDMASPEGPLRTREVPLALDTLFADLIRGTVTLTWRGLVPVASDDLFEVRTALVTSHALGEAPAPAADFEAHIDAFEADPLGVDDHMSEPLRPIAKRMLYDGVPPDQLLDAGDAPRGSDPVSALLAQKLGKTAANEQAQTRDVMARASNVPLHGGDTLGTHVERALASPSPKAAIAPGPPGELASLDVAKAGAALRALRDKLDAIKADAARQGRALPGIDAYEALQQDPRFVALTRAAEQKPPPEPAPGVDLSGCDLTGRDLRGADLRGANLSNAIVSDADLSGANLTGANLSRALLHRAKLTGADLSGANLDNASANEIDAEGAILRGASLDQTILTGARLKGADLRDVKASQALLTSADLSGADLRGADLTKVMAQRCALDRVKAAGASLTQGLFVEASAEGADFTGAVLDGTCFMRAKLDGARFPDARGIGSIWTGASLDRADLRFAVLPRACLLEASAKGSTMRGATLEGARFYRAALDKALLDHANLAGADFSKASLTGAFLTGSNLYRARFDQATMTGLDVTGATLTRSTLERT